MKNIVLSGIFVLALLSSCVDLNQYPEDTISDETFFEKASDYKLYVNGLYPSITRGLPTNRWFDSGTDNFVTPTPDNSVMQHSNSGKASVTSDTWNNAYDNIRKVNYVIEAKDRIADASANQYIGEAYYIRAYYYFTLLQNFGGVPYIDKVLKADSEELYTERSSRDFIATKIIEDLIIAKDLLGWKKDVDECRVNRESALLMITRVGLYEGSWEYYHKEKNTPFAIDNDGTDFLQYVVEAGDELIAYQKDNIFRGTTGLEYYELFNKEDYKDIPGAFYYKHYDADFSIVNVPSCGSMSGFGGGITHEFVTSCLMSDGKPEEISSLVYDRTSQESLISVRDPRLNQIIYNPGRGGICDFFPNMMVLENNFNLPYAPLVIPYQPVSGYTIFKGTVPSIVAKAISYYDDLILRYEEALLNYAEAKAILGTISQSDIDRTVNVIRGRVNMVPMNLSEINSWSVNYSSKDGFDPSASNVVNEIRRERRVELVLEGFRESDLKRWAVYEDVINGYKPRGSYYQELADFFDNEETLKAAGISASDIKRMKFKKGNNIDALGDYVNPHWKTPDLSENGRGYYIDPKRDYLQSIPQNEIDLYMNEKGVVLTQNPGWF